MENRTMSLTNHLAYSWVVLLLLGGCNFQFFASEETLRTHEVRKDQFAEPPTSTTDTTDSTEQVFSISIAPTIVTLSPAQFFSFNVKVQGDGAKVVWRVEEGAGGKVSDLGRYQASIQQGTYHVVAEIEGTDKKASATVVVEQCVIETRTIYSEPGTDSTWNTADDVPAYRTHYVRENGEVIKQVLWTPGADAVFSTEDDEVSSRIDILFGELDGYRRPITEVQYSSPGSDGVWFTSDDLPSGYWTYQTSSNVFEYATFASAGSDAIWFNSDDVLDHRKLFLDTDHLYLYQSGAFRTAGPDGIYDTEDDTWSPVHKIEFFDAAGHKARYVVVDGAGADGLWGTSDDNIRDERRFRYVAEPAVPIWLDGRRYETDFDELSHPGPDLLWGTDDDDRANWSRSSPSTVGLDVTQYEANYPEPRVVGFSRVVVNERGFVTDIRESVSPGADSVLGTDDDEVIRSSISLVCGVERYVDPGVFIEQ